MTEIASLHRWVAEIDYRHDGGIQTRQASMHELSQLHDIVENGPNFYTIAAIRIGPARHCEPMTVEQAEDE